MGGKAKQKDEVVSKTARASSVRKAAGNFETDAELPRLVPTGQGRFAILRHPVTGKDARYRVDSPQFTEALVALGPQWRRKLLAEMQRITRRDIGTTGEWAKATLAFSDAAA